MKGKERFRNEIESIVIQSPCSVRWEDMEGDSGIKFCGQCKKNVHNLSTLPVEQLASVLEERKVKPTCVIISRDKRGKVRFDNCPAFLQAARNRLFKAICGALLMAAWSLAFSASAQGLVGAPVDPRYSSMLSGNELQDFGYDSARNLSRTITMISVAIVFLLPLARVKKNGLRKTGLKILALSWIPILVHLAGTFAINNYGGLGGGL